MLSNILNIVYVVAVVLLLFNLTIFVHELGHFLVGLWRRVTIERFAIWFGPSLWSRVWRGVEFRLGCIPFGGYVAIPQLAVEEIEGKSQTPVTALPPLKPRDKIPILLAGSMANLVLGFLIACLVWTVGVPRPRSETDLTVGPMHADSPEYRAGIRPGDRIDSINGEHVTLWSEINHRVALSLSANVTVGVLRDGNPREFVILPDRDNFFKIRKLNLTHQSAQAIPIADTIYVNSPAEKAGLKKGDEVLLFNGEKVTSTAHLVKLVHARPDQSTPLQIRRGERIMELTVTPRYEKTSGKPLIGVRFGERSDEPLETTYPTPWHQMTDSLLMMVNTLNALFHHKTTGVGVGDLAGPVGIGSMLYVQIQMDFRLALAFLVLLNVNLAVINLLPIPVLDGGHIVFSLIEAARRRPINQKMLEGVHTVFLALLITFMIYVTFNDIDRLGRWTGLFGNHQKAGAGETPRFEEKDNS